MKFVKDFLEQKAQDYATGSMAHMHSAIKLALDLVIGIRCHGRAESHDDFQGRRARWDWAEEP